MEVNVRTRFVLMYVLLGFIAAIPYVGVGVLWHQLGQKPSVQAVSIKAEEAKAAAVREAAGNQNLVAICEANLTNQVNQAGGKVQAYTKPSVTQKGDKATVKVHLKSDIYEGVVTCSLDKSNWQLSNVTAA